MLLYGRGVKFTQDFFEVGVAQFDVYHCIDVFAVGFEPCGLRGHDVIAGDHAFAEAHGGGAEVFVGAFEVGQCGMVGLIGFLCLLGCLADL